MSDIDQMVIKTSLRNMFIKGWVDICSIRECLKLAGVTPSGKVYDQLHVLHCVSFKDMDRELAELIPGMVMGLFDGMQLSVEGMFKRPEPSRMQIIDVLPNQPKKKTVLQLLGLSA